MLHITVPFIDSFVFRKMKEPLGPLTLFIFFFLTILVPHHNISFALGLASSSSYSDMFPEGTWIDRSSFPDNFLIGTLTWAMKHEGAAFADGKGQSVWDVYASMQDKVTDGTTPNDGGGQYYHYQEDIQYMKEMGMNTYRFSIAWTRIYPNGTGEINPAGVDYYNRLIDTMLNMGIQPFVTLTEQDIPQALEDAYGGYLGEKIIDDFANYANTCFSLFGDRVKHWITFDEANDFIPFAFAASYSPPGRCSRGIAEYGFCPEGNSSTEPYLAAHNILLAHAAAATIYKKDYQDKQGGKIGMNVWFRWYEPLNASSPSDIEAAKRINDFTLGWFMDPIFKGDYPKSMRLLVGERLPKFTEEQLESLSMSVDFIGLNAVAAIYATVDDMKHNVTGYFQDMAVKITAYRDGEKIGPGDLEYSVPWCILKISKYMMDTYDNFPVYMTQLGWGMDSLPVEYAMYDVERVLFLSSYLGALIDSIRDGLNVRGVFVWSLIDGFEFTSGLTVRFGLYYVDADFNRYPKLSSLWLKEIFAPQQEDKIFKPHSLTK